MGLCPFQQFHSGLNIIIGWKKNFVSNELIRVWIGGFPSSDWNLQRGLELHTHGCHLSIPNLSTIHVPEGNSKKGAAWPSGYDTGLEIWRSELKSRSDH